LRILLTFLKQGWGAGVGAILFIFFRSRSTLKNWNGAEAGVGADIN